MKRARISKKTKKTISSSFDETRSPKKTNEAQKNTSKTYGKRIYVDNPAKKILGKSLNSVAPLLGYNTEGLIARIKQTSNIIANKDSIIDQAIWFGNRVWMTRKLTTNAYNDKVKKKKKRVKNKYKPSLGSGVYSKVAKSKYVKIIYTRMS